MGVEELPFLFGHRTKLEDIGMSVDEVLTSGFLLFGFPAFLFNLVFRLVVLFELVVLRPDGIRDEEFVIADFLHIIKSLLTCAVAFNRFPSQTGLIDRSVSGLLELG